MAGGQFPAGSGELDRLMRVLHVITALGVGGAERMLLKLLDARALAGIEQYVVAMLPGGKLASEMRSTGAQVIELDFLGVLPVLAGTFGLVRAARRISPDVVHGWLYHGNLGAAVARAALPRRVPLIWGIRQTLSTLEGENLFARIAIGLNKSFSGCPDSLLFNSTTSLEQHRARGFSMKRARYLPNGFDVNGFVPDARARARWRSAWNVRDDDVLFGHFARYHPAKDHAGFLHAARLVRDLRPSARFVLAGTSVDGKNAALKKLILDQGLAGTVQLLGERSDVASLMAALDVYVSSSAHIEAFSNSVGEAMSCGLPSIVTEVGDSPAVVGESGLVVPPRDPVALANAMIAMMDQGAAGRAVLGALARQRIREDFDIDVIAGRYADLYRDMTATVH